MLSSINRMRNEVQKTKVEMFQQTFNYFNDYLSGEPPMVDAETNKLYGGSPPKIEKIEKLIDVLGV